MTRGYRRKTGVLRLSLIITLALALAAPGFSAKERKGANVKVTKNDGAVIKGELLAIKGDNLILMERSTSAEVTESLLGIKTIRIDKKSAMIVWGIVGAVAGAALGAVLAPKGKVDPDSSSMVVDPASGAVLGGLIGAAAGIGLVADGQKIRIRQTDPEHIAKIAARLRKYARDRS